MQDTWLTRTEHAIVTMLSDGGRHTNKELKTCLKDDMAGKTAVRYHLHNIRKKIAHKGETIVCEVHEGKFVYRLVRQVQNS